MAGTFLYFVAGTFLNVYIVRARFSFGGVIFWGRGKFDGKVPGPQMNNHMGLDVMLPEKVE